MTSGAGFGSWGLAASGVVSRATIGDGFAAVWAGQGRGRLQHREGRDGCGGGAWGRGHTRGVAGCGQTGLCFGVFGLSRACCGDVAAAALAVSVSGRGVVGDVELAVADRAGAHRLGCGVSWHGVHSLAHGLGVALMGAQPV